MPNNGCGERKQAALRLEALFHGHHEFANAETCFLVGNALGEGMKKLLVRTSP